jgi:hypothetical protein
MTAFHADHRGDLAGLDRLLDFSGGVRHLEGFAICFVMRWTVSICSSVTRRLFFPIMVDGV